MTNLKMLCKLLIFLSGTLIFYSLIILSSLLRIFGVSQYNSRTFFLKKWGAFSCWVLGMNITVKGKAPEPPFFLVSNHLSYVDIFLLFSQVKAVFVAKSDVKQWPVIGFLIRTSGILFTDRERIRDITRVNKKISKNINEHQGVIIFPESKTSPGFDVLPFKSSLLQTPASMHLPVSYASISYSMSSGEEEACRKICWWNDEPFLIHFFDLLKLDGFEAVITFGEKNVSSTNRKTLTQELHSLVKADFIPVIKEPVFKSIASSESQKKAG